MKSLFLIPSLLTSIAVMGLAGKIHPLSAQTSVPAPFPPSTDNLVADTQSAPAEKPSADLDDIDAEIDALDAGPSIRYECLRTKDNKLLTVAHTPRGRIEMVSWASLFFGKQWSPERRCHTVSDRFQNFSDANQLKFVSTGVVNNYNVLCVSEEEGDCMNNGLLITLEPKDKPVQVLEGMFNYEIPITRGPAVVDIETLLEVREPIPDGTFADETTPEAAPGDN